MTSSKSRWSKEKHSDSDVIAEKKVDIKEDVWDTGPCLTAAEMATLDKNTNQITSLKLKLKILQLEAENLKLTALLSNHKGLLRDRDAGDMHRTYNEKLASCRAFNEELKAKYELKENWGFNPMTGEIDQDTSQKE
jgi:hypothetical protein